MPFEIDASTIVPILFAVLGCNLLCMLVLLVVRPVPRTGKARPTEPLAWSLRVGLAEIIGTFFLVFVALLGLKEGAYVCALLLAVLVAVFGPISGAHFNPAVTLGLIAIGRLNPLAGVWYGLCQVGAALGAVAAHRYALGMETLAVPHPHSLPLGGILLMEAIGSGLLVLTVVGTLYRGEDRMHAPVAIGAALGVAMVATTPYSGGLLNPARYLGVAILSQDYSLWGAYVAGPMLGGLVAATFVQFFVQRPTITDHPRQLKQAYLFDDETQAA